MKKWSEGSTVKRNPKGRLNTLRYVGYFLIRKEKWRLKKFQCVHPVYKQREDAIPPLSYFVDFLDNFIE